MLKYIGNGAALPDVPARDLTDEEVERCGGEEKLIASGIYIKEGKPPASGIEKHRAVEKLIDKKDGE